MKALEDAIAAKADELALRFEEGGKREAARARMVRAMQESIATRLVESVCMNALLVAEDEIYGWNKGPTRC